MAMENITSGASKRGSISQNRTVQSAVANAKNEQLVAQAAKDLGTLWKTDENLTKDNVVQNKNIVDAQTSISLVKESIITGYWTFGLKMGQPTSSEDIIELNTILTNQETKLSNSKKKFSNNNKLLAANATKEGKLKTANVNNIKSLGYGGSKVVKNTAAKITPPPLSPTSDYQWNLPPHTWSLPLDPYEIAPDTVNKRTDSYHSTRRGRIWYYNGYVGPTNVANPETGLIAAPKDGSSGTVNKYGFQFIWNPETFTQNTSVNMSVTPSGSDPTVALTGFAAANSTMNFTLRLDRTNDFACAKAFTIEDLVTNLPPLPTITGTSKEAVAANKIVSSAQAALNKEVKIMNYTYGNIQQIAKYYRVGQPFGSDQNFTTNVEDKIKDLLTYGTESDLEYLYRVINGDGWKGIGGRATSNIGYLMPSLIRLDLGNQKFVGVVSSASVTHLAFTRDLIPIRSDVSITVDLRANIQPTTNNGTTTA